MHIREFLSYLFFTIGFLWKPDAVFAVSWTNWYALPFFFARAIVAIAFPVFQDVRGILLLHVFNERLLGFENDDNLDSSVIPCVETDTKSASQMTNRYYLVAFEDRGKQGTRYLTSRFPECSRNLSEQLQ